MHLRHRDAHLRLTRQATNTEIIDDHADQISPSKPLLPPIAGQSVRLASCQRATKVFIPSADEPSGVQGHAAPRFCGIQTMSAT